MSRLLRLLVIAGSLGVGLAGIGEEVARPSVHLQPPADAVGSTTLRPLSPLRLSASVHYGDDLRTTLESRETMEFLVYERGEGETLRRVARVEVPLTESPTGGHFAWCELDPPIGGWPVDAIAEARLRGMRQTRDRREAKFESFGATDDVLREMDAADRIVVDRPSSDVTLVLGHDREATVPAGSTFLVEGFVEIDDERARDNLPIEGMIVAKSGLAQIEELRAEGLWLHANAFPTLWPTGEGRSWFQMELVAPQEPGGYRVRTTLETDAGKRTVGDDIRLTVTPANAGR